MTKILRRNFDMRNFEDELDIINEEYDDDNDFLQGLIDDACIEETIQIWLDNLLEATGKSSVDELTAEEIRAEIDEMRGTIRNEECLIGVYEFAEENLKQMFKYLERLEEMLNNKEEPTNDN
jgi:glutathionyl-hydroquinone reductase